MLLTFDINVFFKSLRSLLNFWQISSHGNSVSDFWILLSTLIHWWKVIDSLLLWKSSIFNSRSEQLTPVECIRPVDWVLHKKSTINYCTLFASAILAGEVIPFDNSSIFLQISHKHENCGMALLNTSSFRLFRKAQSWRNISCLSKAFGKLSVSAKKHSLAISIRIPKLCFFMIEMNGFFYKATVTVIQDMFYWLEIKKRVYKARLGRNDTFKSLCSSRD